MTRARGRTNTVRAIGDGKGYFGRRKNCLKTRKDAVRKAGQYSYVGRRVKKRDYRSLWIQRINAAVRQFGISYSVFMGLLNHGSSDKTLLNKKTLSELAVNHKAFFATMVQNLLKKSNYLTVQNNYDESN